MMDDLEQWADDHGYTRCHCKRHGSFWSDTGYCESCLNDKEDYEEDKPNDEENEQ